MGGFNLNVVNQDGSTGCTRTSTGLAGTTGDYIPHHSFFNYWTSTANYAHTRPASPAEIGWNGPANHQYDIADFVNAASAGNLPAVSFLKAPAFQDGHAGYSDPLDEQTFDREDRQPASSISRRGAAPLSWSCTTTPTDGTTTR